MAKRKRRYTHNCLKCVFVCQVLIKGTWYDHYKHANMYKDGSESNILRYGNDRAEYYSGYGHLAFEVAAQEEV